MAKKENDTETVGEELDLDAFLAEINTSPKLEEAQISTLEAFLDAQASMHMEMLDGYFCALICGPDA
ncbi:MAG: YecA family protein, partial [Burkholderiaceae bacterium]|nr:YecA family protein [Burkholderiaceae bacterium]